MMHNIWILVKHTHTHTKLYNSICGQLFKLEADLYMVTFKGIVMLTYIRRILRHFTAGVTVALYCNTSTHKAQL